MSRVMLKRILRPQEKLTLSLKKRFPANIIYLGYFQMDALYHRSERLFTESTTRRTSRFFESLWVEQRAYVRIFFVSIG
jgi:hypothetical protein